ncbi:hypothetical protein NG895_14925 [Aeoliella sp. ICT_H6.2]|uniref:Uncharacterized protein n=1 Tax=Aeoliella straminimaris TaxID=2954799 RepID=A0A9X2FBM8_9BACT|nr:hypothetical protein [Aeoliella straminimaris]MCO6045203.1 hypothetical protein [Aeoliella straminimaris]
MDAKQLERMARQYRRDLWTPGEVVYQCFVAAGEREATSGVQALRDAVSRDEFRNLQAAARQVLDSMHPDAEWYGVGFVTPEVPPCITEIPRTFLEEMVTDH